MTVPAFSAALLTGGRSSRMGTDKALLTVDGATLVTRGAAALEAAGAQEVYAVGGDRAALESLGLVVIDDRWPGEGPLGAIITALHAAREGVVVVVACDHPVVDAELVLDLVTLLAIDPGVDAVVPQSFGRDQVLFAAYRKPLVESLTAAFAAGERSTQRAIGERRVLRKVVDDPRWLRSLTDVDTPNAFAAFFP